MEYFLKIIKLKLWTLYTKNVSVTDEQTHASQHNFQGSYCPVFSDGNTKASMGCISKFSQLRDAIRGTGWSCVVRTPNTANVAFI